MKALTTIFLSLFLILPCMAEDKSDGCGVANMINDKKTMLGISIRSTTNSTVIAGLLNTSATSSGTFGCETHTVVRNNIMKIHYLNANIDQIALDASQGRGEYLDALARQMGCQDHSIDDFSAILKRNYSDVFLPNLRNQRQTLDKIQMMIKNHKALAFNCQNA